MIVTSAVAGWVLVVAMESRTNQLVPPTVWPTQEVCESVGKSYRRNMRAASRFEQVSPSTKESDYVSFECIEIKNTPVKGSVPTIN